MGVHRGWRYQEGPVPYFTIPAFEATGKVRHGFSTRLGGVSQGCFSSLNLGPTRGDDPQAVEENYRRLCGAIGVDWTQVVLSHQTHTDHIRLATREDAGKGLLRPRDYDDVDGLITVTPGLPLVTFFADCVPLIFLDPVREVLCSVHSGWRGTVQRIGARAVERMTEEFGCRREDILAAVGPCIGPCHYQVDEDCADQFRKAFPETFSRIARPEGEGKYRLDLPEANLQIFLENGLRPENITMAGLCTYCDEQRFFSHRRMGDKRGNLAMVIQLG
ncbi:MAG: peptidoglycan editing factor PgeF [Eubacteriales bacterium]